MAGVYPGHSFEFLKDRIQIVLGVGEVNHVELVTPFWIGKFLHKSLEDLIWVKLNPNLLLFFYQKMFEVDLKCFLFHKLFTNTGKSVEEVKCNRRFKRLIYV